MNEQSPRPYRLCVAPMMDWTDRHCRYFHRLLAPHARLYTEMVTTGAVIHGDRERLIGFSSAEHPVAVQLGGSDPDELAQAARICEDFGYDEVNLNVGCPSDRVQSGRFGACLMREPELVRDCLGAMIEAVDIPVTVKHRIGVDDQDEVADLDRFVTTTRESGCRVYLVHARKAWLKGLSPKENREVPPLQYDRVMALKRRFPELTVVVNGGIDSMDAARRFDGFLDGVMVGRAAYHNPYLLAELEASWFGTELAPRETYVDRLIPYLQAQLRQGVFLKHMTRHVLGLFQGQPGARRWRRTLSENAHRPGADETLLERALPALSAHDQPLPPERLSRSG